MLFSRYKADFLRFFPENAANYVSILMYELQRKAPSERRKSHFRGPRFQIFRGLVHQSTKPLDPPLIRMHKRQCTLICPTLLFYCLTPDDFTHQWENAATQWVMESQYIHPFWYL